MIKYLIYILILYYSLSIDGKAQPIASNASKTIDENIRILSLADIHFDPFNGCRKVPCALIAKLRTAPVSSWQAIFLQYDNEPQLPRTNTGYQLLISTLSKASSAAKTYRVHFVIILGDFLGHNFRALYKKYSEDSNRLEYQAFVKKIFQFLDLELKQFFPTQDIYAVIGNNDSYKGDYYFDQTGRFFSDTSQLWGSLIKNKYNRAAMQQQFSKSGYYVVSISNVSNNILNEQNGPSRLIILNTVLFSLREKGTTEHAANLQLKWLRNQLMQAQVNHQQVFIAMHIPMNFDVFLTKRFRLFRLMRLWKTKYIHEFEQLLQQYKSQITGIFTGHLHSNWFQILKVDDVEIPMTGTISVSPIFGNNPGFKIYNYDVRSKTLKEHKNYNYNLENKSWNEVTQGDKKEIQIFYLKPAFHQIF